MKVKLKKRKARFYKFMSTGEIQLSANWQQKLMDINYPIDSTAYDLEDFGKICIEKFKKYIKPKYESSYFLIEKKVPHNTDYGEYDAHIPYTNVLKGTITIYRCNVVTFLHELAHHVVTLFTGPKTQNHGKVFRAFFKAIISMCHYKSNRLFVKKTTLTKKLIDDIIKLMFTITAPKKINIRALKMKNYLVTSRWF